MIHLFAHLTRLHQPPAERQRHTARAYAWPLTVVLAAISQHAWSACSVTAQGVNFGNYDPFSRTDLDGAGNIIVKCDVGVAYSIALSSGSGTYAARFMTNGAYALNYNLYTDASRIFTWGDGAGATATVSGSGGDTISNIPIYGRIARTQSAHTGNYTDAIIVTVAF